jgi:hypothetical protein
VPPESTIIVILYFIFPVGDSGKIMEGISTDYGKFRMHSRYLFRTQSVPLLSQEPEKKPETEIGREECPLRLIETTVAELISE